MRSSSDDESSESSSDSYEESPPRLFFYGKIPEVPVDNRSQSEREIFVCKPLDKLYVCEKTRPLWMNKVDYNDKESPLDKPFPVVPFSKKSTEIYKKFRSRWSPNLTSEERKILFGEDAASIFSDEIVLKVLCQACKPKVTPRPKLPENFPRSMLRKLRFLTMMKESSRVEKERKAILSQKEIAKQPKDVMKDIMDRAMKKVQQEFDIDENSELMDKLKLEAPPECCRHDDQVGLALAFAKNENLLNGSIEYRNRANCSTSDNISNIYSSKSTSQMRRSPKEFNSTERVQKKEYLKPGDFKKNGKSSYDNELTIKKVNLLEKLDRNDLKELKCYFFPKNYYDDNKIMAYSLSSQTQYNGIPLRKKEFVQAIDYVIGSKESTYAAARLFETLESEGKLEHGVIWWEQFLDIIISSGNASRSYSEINTVITDEVKTKYTLISKSPIIKIINIVYKGKTMFIAMARLGEVAVLDENLKLVYSYKVPINHYKSKNCCWLTDACYSHETETMFIVSSSRCLFLYNTSRDFHKLMQQISGMWEIPECINYTELKKNEGLLLIGDIKGSITSFHFKRTNKSFFKIIPNRNTNQSYIWQDVIDEPDWVEIRREKNVHNDIIMQIVYIKRSDCIISCSLDNKISVAIRQTKASRAAYIFAIEKGVKSFCIDNQLGLLATISGDTLVRVWDPVNPRKPIGFLKGHEHAVLDVAIIASRRIAITCAENMELKVWDVETFNCQQTLLLKFKDVPHTRHVMLKFRSIYIDYEQQDSQLSIGSALSPHGSSRLTSSHGTHPDQKEVKNILIVKMNDVKMLKIGRDYIEDNVEGTDIDSATEEKISDQPCLSDESQSDDEANAKQQMLDLINEYCADDNDLADKYKYLRSGGVIEFLEDFVKEGTPYLALHLHQTVDINDIHKINDYQFKQ